MHLRGLIFLDGILLCCTPCDIHQADIYKADVLPQHLYTSDILLVIMATDIKSISDQLDDIKAGIDYIKERLTDVDTVLMDDDIDALKEAEADFRTGRTKRL